ncbi:MAG: methylenetetrahydrofolate reductase [NAD(P)H] [Flavobacteriales bacterium]|nr:methylenetetrahydrofolate reductase [NAD(P)H] [Flavobacteriales bacterium]
MKVSEHLQKAKKPLISFEILPPLKGKSIQSIYDSIDPLMDFKPSFINVTYHREEFVFKKREKGFLERISIKKRPGTVGICAAIMNRYEIDAIPHIICGGFTQEETENALIDLNFLGIDNVLALRGDPIKSESAFVPETGGHANAIDLVKQIVKLNNGEYFDEDLQNANPTNFCIGVAGYPEKHFESPNFKTDIKHLKAKVDAGAEYIITQLFYDTEKFKNFVSSCREVGIHVPIIPGLKPISNKSQLVSLSKFFHIDLPDDLVDAIEKCKNDDAVKQVGIEWAIQQSKDLLKFGSPCIHYYTMGKSVTTREIIKQVF